MSSLFSFSVSFSCFSNLSGTNISSEMNIIHCVHYVLINILPCSAFQLTYSFLFSDILHILKFWHLNEVNSFKTSVFVVVYLSRWSKLNEFSFSLGSASSKVTHLSIYEIILHLRKTMLIELLENRMRNELVSVSHP